MLAFCRTIFHRCGKWFFNLLGFQSHFIATPWGHCHVYCSRSRDQFSTPLLMIHGLGASGLSWLLMALFLKGSTTIIIPDLFAMSGYSTSARKVFTPPQYADALWDCLGRFLLRLGYARDQALDVVGLSLGGWIAMHMDLQKPGRIHHMALFNPAGILGSSDSRGEHLKNTLLTMNWNDFKPLFSGIVQAFPYQHIPGIRSLLSYGLYKEFCRPNVRAFLGNINESHVIDHKVKDISCSVLLIWGEGDHFLHSDTATFLAEHVPQIDGYWVEGCAHLVPIESPSTSAIMLLRFLKRTHPKGWWGLVGSFVWPRLRVRHIK